MMFILKWIIRLAVVAALAGLAVLALNRRRAVGRAEEAIERVDDNLRSVEKGLRKVERKTEDAAEAAADVKDRIQDR